MHNIELKYVQKAPRHYLLGSAVRIASQPFRSALIITWFLYFLCRFRGHKSNAIFLLIWPLASVVAAKKREQVKMYEQWLKKKSFNKNIETVRAKEQKRNTLCLSTVYRHYTKWNKLVERGKVRIFSTGVWLSGCKAPVL